MGHTKTHSGDKKLPFVDDLREKETLEDISREK